MSDEQKDVGPRKFNALVRLILDPWELSLLHPESPGVRVEVTRTRLERMFKPAVFATSGEVIKSYKSNSGIHGKVRNLQPDEREGRRDVQRERAVPGVYRQNERGQKGDKMKHEFFIPCIPPKATSQQKGIMMIGGKPRHFKKKHVKEAEQGFGGPTSVYHDYATT